MGRLNGKVAIITASTDGIGFAIAKRLAEEGSRVVICSRNNTNICSALKNLREHDLEVFGVQCHVGNATDRHRLFKETIEIYGRLDILVSNAATNPSIEPLFTCEESAWDKIFHVNVKASFMLAKEAVHLIRKHGSGGIIVFISSIVGFDPQRALGVYSVSKTALIGLTKAAAKHLAHEGIRVNCVAPGIIQTKFSSKLIQMKGPKALSLIPMNRFGRVREVADVVAFLVSDDASYITGETIVTSGGLASRL